MYNQGKYNCHVHTHLIDPKIEEMGFDYHSGREAVVIVTSKCTPPVIDVMSDDTVHEEDQSMPLLRDNIYKLIKDKV